jgi:hypothetical protein
MSKNNMKQKIEEIKEAMVESLADIMLGERIPLDFFHKKTAEILYPANRKMTKTILRKVVNNYRFLLIDPSPIRNKILEVLYPYGLLLDAYEDWVNEHQYPLRRLKSMVKQWELEEANNHHIYSGDAWLLLFKLIKSEQNQLNV